MPNTKIDIADLRGRITRHDYPDWADIAPLLDQLEQSQREVERLKAERVHPEPERTEEIVKEAYAYLSTVHTVDGQMPEPALLVQRLQSRLIRVTRSLVAPEASQARVAELTTEVERWKVAAEANTEEATDWETKWHADHEALDASLALVARLRGALEKIALEGENGMDMWGCRFAARDALKEGGER